MNRLLKFILVTGFIAGTLDIIGAYILSYINSGKFAAKLFHYIAGGWLGSATSMTGGTGTVLLGVLSHYFIATSFVAFFFLLYPRIKLLRFNPVIAGLLYGLFIDLVMKNIVLPLSALHSKPAFDWNKFLINSLIVGLAIGIPAAIASKKYYLSRTLSSAAIIRK